MPKYTILYTWCRSVADPGCLSRIPDPDFCPSWIPDLGYRIQEQQEKRGVKKISCPPFFCRHKSTNITKLKTIYFWTDEEKNLGQFTKNYSNFYQKNCHLVLKNLGLGSGIRDTGSEKNLFRIPDPQHWCSSYQCIRAGACTEMQPRRFLQTPAPRVEHFNNSSTTLVDVNCKKINIQRKEYVKNLPC